MHTTKAEQTRSAWTNTRVTSGIWSTVADPMVAEILGRSGADFVCVDLQHGAASPESATNLFQVLRPTPATAWARVAWDHPDAIMRVLDMGADGVIVPMIETGKQAAAAVAACRYPPRGHRSWGPMWADADPALADVDATPLVAVMVETATGLSNVADIAATPGLDAIYIGPNDLALSCGRGRASYADDIVVHDAIETVLAAADAASVVTGLHCSTTDMARYWAQRGVRMLTIATDSTMIATSARDALSRMRHTP